MAGVAFKIHFYSICFYYSVHWTIWQAILFSHFRLLRVCNNKRNKKHWTDVGITFCDLLQFLYFCVWFYLIIDFLSFLRPLHGKEIDFSTDVTVKLIANENFIYFCYILLGKKIVEIQNDGWARRWMEDVKIAMNTWNIVGELLLFVRLTGVVM